MMDAAHFHTTTIREPESPVGLAEFERHVMAANAPAVVLIDRALIRALLRNVRRLERKVRRLELEIADEDAANEP